MKIARVFPRKTAASPIDEMSFFGKPELWTECDEVHISVTWTYDLPRAEQLARSWKHVAKTLIGGPATGMRGGEFTPGMYLKPGYVITSRGCPNRCWFCSVPQRDGKIRELEIKDGWNVLDDNLLACSEKHIRAVFAMLQRQPRKAEFTGGIEAKRLQPWHVELFAALKPAQIFFAYDTADDLEPLINAGKMLQAVGLKIKHPLRCYVLCGYRKDTQAAAEKRMFEAVKAGFLPMAMLYQDFEGKTDPAWKQWQRQWARPAIISQKINDPAFQAVLRWSDYLRFLEWMDYLEVNDSAAPTPPQKSKRKAAPSAGPHPSSSAPLS